jgi:hypothetical protein
MGGLGTLNFNSGDSGNGIQAFDDKMPTAWEETWGAGLSTSMPLVSGVGPNANVQYTSPTGGGATFVVAYAPKAGTTDTADKTGGGSVAGSTGSILDVTLNMNPDFGTEFFSGLNMFFGGSVLEGLGGTGQEDDAYQGVVGITFDLGPFSFGRQFHGKYTGETGTADYNTYKNHAYGIAFNINDDLSISYGKMDSRKVGYTHSSVPGKEDSRFMEINSVQIAYTVGGASSRVAETSGDNVGFGTSANDDTSATVVSLGLAF